MIWVNQKEMERIKKSGVALLICGSVLLTGYGKEAECPINGYHIHKYTDEAGYTKYVESEKMSLGEFNRNDEYILISKEEEEYYKKVNKAKLLLASNNYETIDKLLEENSDYLEYEYRHTYITYMMSGKVLIPITHVSYNWTTDKNDSRLTGKVRIIHPMYQAYDIKKDENGKLVVVVSDIVDNLYDVIDEYPYIRKDDVKETVLDDTLSLDSDGNVYYSNGTLYKQQEKITTRTLKRN